MRAFTSADMVQQELNNSGSAVASPSIAMPAGTTEGNTVIIVMGAGTQILEPENFDISGRSGGGTAAVQLGILSRPDVPAGETTWPFAVPGAGTAMWTWSAEEWTNVSFSAVETNSQTLLTASPASKSTGTTGTSGTEYVMCIAALLIFGGTTSGVWSGGSWSNGFTETDVISFGPGDQAVNQQVRIARYYGTQNEAGPWETTFTFTGGAQTNKIAYACMTVFRAEDQVVTDVAGIMS